MHIGITGASGHIGANLTRILLNRGFTLKVLIHKDEKAISDLPVEKVYGSLHNEESLDRLCEGVDVVLHLAAYISIGGNSFDKIHRINVLGTKNLVAACKRAGVKRCVYFSSIHAFDHHPLQQPLDESRPLITESPQAYERTKSIAEKWILTQISDNFEVVILNPSAVIGPNDFKPSLMGRMLLNLYRGRLPFFIPGGYNWVDVRDVAEAAANAITKGRSGEHYILAGGWHSLKEIAATMEKATGKKIRNIVLPFWMAYAGVPFIRIWSFFSGQKPLYTKESLDIVRFGNKHILTEKAERELGFKPHPFFETIQDTLNWFLENKYL